MTFFMEKAMTVPLAPRGALIKAVMLCAVMGHVSACLPAHSGMATPAEVAARPGVTLVRLTHDITGEADGSETLSETTQAALQHFLTSQRVGYGDVLYLDTGGGLPIARQAMILEFLADRGIRYGEPGTYGRAPETGAARLYVERYRLDTPACPNWQAELSAERSNNESTHFGCATTVTLARMTANPHHLVAGTATDSAAVDVRAARAITTLQQELSGGNGGSFLSSLFGGGPGRR